jgi:hypothetical protein
LFERNQTEASALRFGCAFILQLLVRNHRFPQTRETGKPKIRRNEFPGSALNSA